MIRRNHIPILLGVMLLCFAWISTDVSVPNERSRIYLAVSLIDDHSLSIDNALERFGRVPDLAARDGQHFTDKAPGSSLLGAVIYGFGRLITDADDWTNEALILLMRFGLMIPLTLGGFFLLRRFLQNLGFDPPVVDLASFGWLVATPVLHYGQAFYGHQIVAVALLGAVVLLMREDRRWWHMAGAGACAGLAGITEYQAALPCVLLAVWVLTGPARKRPLELIAFFGVAGLFVAFLLGYHTVAFGGPFELSYNHLATPAFEARHADGIGGVLMPHWEAVFGGFFSLHRGILLTSPIVVVALVGIPSMIREIGARQAALLLAILVYFGLFIASSNTWEAGWGYGTRLLVPALGLAMLPVAFGFDRMRRSTALSALALASVAVGMVSMVAMKLTFFEAPPSSTNPLMDVALPMVTNQWSSPSWVTAVGLPMSLSLVVGALMAMALFLILAHRYAGLHRPKAILWSLGITALFFSLIYVIGPTWDDSQAARFDGFLEREVIQD